MGRGTGYCFGNSTQTTNQNTEVVESLMNKFFYDIIIRNLIIKCNYYSFFN